MSVEVPDGWEPVQLSSIVDNKTTKWNENSNGESYIGLEHIAQEVGTLCGVGNSSDVLSAKNTFEVGDVLFGKLRPNLKKYWHASFRGICSTDILVLRAGYKIRSDFLFALVQSNQFLDLAISDAVGTKMPRTSWSRLGELNLNLPPLPEQQRIAEILSSVDESIRAAKAVIAQAERVKRGLMEDLLTGGLGSAAIANGEVPDGWEKQCLSEVLVRDTSAISASELASVGNVYHYSIPAFDEGQAPILEAGDQIRSNKTRISEDCLLFSKLNPRIPRVWRVLAKHKFPAVCSTEFWAFMPSQRKPSLDYFKHFLAWDGFLSNPQIKPSSSTNSHQRIDRKAFDAFEVLLPPLPKQQRIAEILSSVDGQITASRATVEQLQRLKRGLIDDLLTGKVRTVA